jgi:SAM-dependent methyltransferase
MADIALPLGKVSQRDALFKTAASRLHPRLTDPNFLVLRSRRIIFEKWIAQFSGEDLTVLDIGGRYQPYRPLFKAKAGRYVACDIKVTELVDVVGDGESLPFVENTFDVVVATQVFEYFSEPHRAARQIRAALKPGGCLLMSVASVAPRFVDEECWRFTPQGIRGVLSGFTEVEIVPELSSVGGMFRMMNLAVSTFSRYEGLRALAAVTAFPLLNLSGLGLEALRLTDNDQFTPNYSVLAIK